MKVFRKIAISGIVICALIFTSSISFALNNGKGLINGDKENKEIDKIINEIPTLLNSKQYDKFIALTDGSLNTSFYDLFLGSDSQQNKQNNIGLWNVDNIKLIKYKQISNSQAPSGSINYSDYSEYKDITTYYLALNVTAKENNSDIFSGANYYLWVFGKKGNNYKLLQWSQPIIKEMQNSNIAFNESAEDLQSNAQNARLHGEMNAGIGTQVASTNVVALTVNNPSDCPIPTQIRVKKASNGIISTVNFYSYVKNVLPNEWTASADPIESLKAGAMVVKMYGWYRCYNYKYYGQGFDVYDDTKDQVYKAGSEYSRSTNAINAIGGIAIKNTNGLLFETQYLASGPTANSGKLSHAGANTLANKGKSWFYICNYYYSYSNKSTYDIVSFNYY